MVGTFKLRWKSDGWLLVRDKVRNIWKYMQNVTDLELMVTWQVNGSYPFNVPDMFPPVSRGPRPQ